MKTNYLRVSVILYVNGVTGTGRNYDITCTSSTMNLSTISIGGWSGDLNRTFNGGISCLIVYNSVLSTTDRQTLEGALAWKWWGNGNILDVTHPYHSKSP